MSEWDHDETIQKVQSSGKTNYSRNVRLKLKVETGTLSAPPPALVVVQS